MQNTQVRLSICSLICALALPTVLSFGAGGSGLALRPAHHHSTAKAAWRPLRPAARSYINQGLSSGVSMAVVVDTENPVAATFSRFKRDYLHRISRNQQYDLAVLLSTPTHSIEKFCLDFSPNEQGRSSDPVVEAWLRDRGLLIEHKGPIVLKMVAYFIGKSSSAERYETAAKLFMIDYFVNDFCGREEVQSAQAGAKQAEVMRAITLACGMVRSDTIHLSENTLKTFSPPVRRVLTGLLEVLGCVKSTSPAFWFDRFLHNFEVHFLASFDQERIEHIHTVSDYVEHRRKNGGMEYSADLFEYALERFINLDVIAESKPELHSKLMHFRDCGSDLGGLWNDVFSFEKETKCCTRPFHHSLIPMIGVNQPGASLEFCIMTACRMLSRTFGRYMELRDEIRSISTDPAILSFVDQSDSGVYAGWVWQATSPRYKVENSIWKQTDLRAGASSAAASEVVRYGRA